MGEKKCVVMSRWVFAIVLLLIGLADARGTEPKLLLGPMIGHTDGTSTRIWVRASGEARIDVLVGLKSDLSDARLVQGPTLVETAAFVGVVKVSGLKPDTVYFYDVALNGKRNAGPHPSFRTAVARGTRGRLRVAFSSCNGRQGVLAAETFSQLKATGRADLMLQLGDNHYGDTTNPTKLRGQYLDHRRVPAFQAIASRIPFYGIWDDHDYGPNDSDRTAKGKEQSLQVFKEHWANPGFGEEDNPGIYFTFARSGVRFIGLDDRFYRDPNKSAGTPEKTMLGARQKAWFKKMLLESKERVKLVLCGSEFQLNGHRDSWTSFKHEQSEILGFIQKNKIKGVILLSGDRHFSAAYQIGGKTIEITAGPMGSKNYPTKVLPDMFMRQNQGKLFAVLDIDTKSDPPVVAVEFHRAGKGLVQRRILSWSEINGLKRIEALKP